jgi:hypothetical protein
MIGVFTIEHAVSQSVRWKSVHQEQSEYYAERYPLSDFRPDSCESQPQSCEQINPDCHLIRNVFGYHPYWAGSAYLGYQWNLISDLCYFSFEVDPATGFPLTTHDFLTAPVIDSALTHGVGVHLCVTLFSSHTLFFSNPQAQQMLIDTLLALVLLRNASGVNIDFEAVPYSVKDQLNQFLFTIATTFHEEIPGSVVSIAAPAIDPENLLDLGILNDHIDLIMIMGYDYYWNGSSQAGPVSGLFPMVQGQNYSLTRTLSWYLSLGVPSDRILLGVPYYGRQWPTLYQFAPSQTTGYGVALTYSTVRNNASGFYSDINKHLENNSLSPYYSFTANGWNQCFIEDAYSMGKKLDLALNAGVAGIGIWALSYDKGYDDFWKLIQDKLSDCQVTTGLDTIFDSGGPAFAYYNNEDYCLTLHPDPCEELSLRFLEFDLEEGYDYLTIYDGMDTTYPLVGIYSGAELPAIIRPVSGALTLHFTSDAGNAHSGWKAVWQCEPVNADETPIQPGPSSFTLRPNPVLGQACLDFQLAGEGEITMEFCDMTGRVLGIERLGIIPGSPQTFCFYPGSYGIMKAGIYLLRIQHPLQDPVIVKWIYIN